MYRRADFLELYRFTKQYKSLLTANTAY